MLTEADMIRIMAEKYRLAESVAEEFIVNEALDVLGIDKPSEKMCYCMLNISDFIE